MHFLNEAESFNRFVQKRSVCKKRAFKNNILGLLMHQNRANGTSLSAETMAESLIWKTTSDRDQQILVSYIVTDEHAAELETRLLEALHAVTFWLHPIGTYGVYSTDPTRRLCTVERQARLATEGTHQQPQPQLQPQPQPHPQPQLQHSCRHSHSHHRRESHHNSSSRSQTMVQR